MAKRSECEAVVRQLWPFIDEVVSETKREEIVQHLEECTDCASHFDFARAFLDAVAQAKPYFEVDGALEGKVMAALAGEGYRS